MSEHAQLASLLASSGSFTQDTRLLRLTTSLGKDLLAECMHGEEGISRGYHFVIDALCTEADVPLKSLIGQPALLQLLGAEADSLRPFHGIVSAMEMSGANGGFVRYTLTLKPWSSFLSRGRDSRTFQDMSVFDILDVVFGSYAGRARLAPEWRMEIADRSIYPKRSLTMQYQESDLAFVERLMHEEGLFYFFEHEGDPDSPTLGRHTMVIADHNGAFRPNPQARVEFTRPGAVMKADSIDRWRTESRLLTNVQACEAARQVHVAAGTVRTFVPGTRFTLHGHARFDEADSDDGRSFVITGATHLMHNNLTADMLDTVGKLLGAGPVASAAAHEPELRVARARHVPGERPLYRNRIEAIAASVPYRGTGQEGHGHILHPRPAVRGQQTAIVVGPPGAVVHTDRDHRIKVQFHWQHGAASQSRVPHPFPDGHTGT